MGQKEKLKRRGFRYAVPRRNSFLDFGVFTMKSSMEMVCSLQMFLLFFSIFAVVWLIVEELNFGTVLWEACFFFPFSLLVWAR